MFITAKIEKFFLSKRNDGSQNALATVNRIETNLFLPNGSMLKNGDKIGITGIGIPDVGQVFTFDGDLVKGNNVTNPVFTVKHVHSVEGKADTMTLLTSVKGIGPSIAKKMISSIGEDCIEKIAEDVEILNNLGLSRFQEKIEILNSKKISVEHLEFFSKLGFNQKQVSLMIKYADVNLVEEFKVNPYKFIIKNEIDFKKIDIIAMSSLNIDSRDSNRLKSAVEQIMLNLNADGSTYFDKNNVVEYFKTLTGLSDSSYISKTIKEMIDSNILWARVDKNTKQTFLGLVETLEKELFIAKELMRRCKDKTNINVDKYIRDKELSSGFTLAESQKEAVRKAINNKVFVLKGGPGTGKTFTLTAIIDTYAAITPNTDIICLAPTGRAAKRMTESTGRNSQTIHSFLKLRPGVVKTDVVTNADLLIVDESSMLDVDIASAIVSALQEKTKIIFVGDTNQLPSIGTGNVLYDLIFSNIIPSTELQVVYRQAEDSNISKNANKILEGIDELITDDDFEFISVNSPEEAQSKILSELVKSVKNYGLIETCVLTPVRRNKDTSVNSINPIAQSLLNPSDGMKDEIVVKGKTFRLGDKVMVTKNSNFASNGDIGIIVSINNTNNEVFVDLGYDSIISISNDDLEMLDLSYAMTIHKSQGSEYDCVIISIMDEHKALLQRNLIYTAITRAKKKIIIVGQKSAISKSISGVQPKRDTLLRYFLEKLS